MLLRPLGNHLVIDYSKSSGLKNVFQLFCNEISMSGLEPRKKSKICRQELSSSTILMKNWIEQQLLRNVQNSRAKGGKQLFFLVEYAKL